VNDDRSTGITEPLEPVATRLRHAPGRRQVSWDLLRSGFVLLVVAYHTTYVAPVIHPELAPRPLRFSHQVGASLLLVISAYFAAASVGRHPIGRYWWGRIARLMPAFLATVVLAWATMRYLAPSEWYIPGTGGLSEERCNWPTRRAVLGGKDQS
jgi:peptidoglycan/LPS O-acetylase OafA/YrhL